MNQLGKSAATSIEVDDANAGQRIDNFLVSRFKGVPKSHLYRIIRSGEVRVNSKRVGAAGRLAVGDVIRVPPIRAAEPNKEAAHPSAAQLVALEGHILYEDASLLVLDKPAGLAVHGGSGVSLGAIEAMRAARPQQKFLELVHRLDRDTSGILLLAKKRSALLSLHRQMRSGEVDKRYLVLVKGEWRQQERTVRLALTKFVTADGERRVQVKADGLASETVFRLRERYGGYSLLEAQLKTGRTHQIRVHLAHLGFPIAGDDKYGDFPLNKKLTKVGLKRMFLHAARLHLKHPESAETLPLEAKLPADLAGFLVRLGPGAALPQ
jgi:23S rRNA pseudouridine955/2504/2580 synthase